MKKKTTTTGAISVEFNLCNKKFITDWFNNPHINMTENHIQTVSKSLDSFYTTDNQIVQLGNFTVGIGENHIKDFRGSNGIDSLIKQHAIKVSRTRSFFRDGLYFYLYFRLSFYMLLI